MRLPRSCAAAGAATGWMIRSPRLDGRGVENGAVGCGNPADDAGVAGAVGVGIAACGAGACGAGACGLAVAVGAGGLYIGATGRGATGGALRGTALGAAGAPKAWAGV